MRLKRLLHDSMRDLCSCCVSKMHDPMNPCLYKHLLERHQPCMLDTVNKCFIICARVVKLLKCASYDTSSGDYNNSSRASMIFFHSSPLSIRIFHFWLTIFVMWNKHNKLVGEVNTVLKAFMKTRSLSLTII